MSYRHIEVERRGEIEIIRLNRPRYRNAQSRILLEEMTQAFARADLDNDVKVIVLAAAGDHFSAGRSRHAGRAGRSARQALGAKGSSGA